MLRQSVLAFIHTDVLIECRYSTSNAGKQKLQEYFQTLYIGLRYQWFNVGRFFFALQRCRSIQNRETKCVPFTSDKKDMFIAFGYRRIIRTNKVTELQNI